MRRQKATDQMSQPMFPDSSLLVFDFRFVLFAGFVVPSALSSLF